MKRRRRWWRYDQFKGYRRPEAAGQTASGMSTAKSYRKKKPKKKRKEKNLEINKKEIPLSHHISSKPNKEIQETKYSRTKRFSNLLDQIITHTQKLKRNPYKLLLLVSHAQNWKKNKKKQKKNQLHKIRADHFTGYRFQLIKRWENKKKQTKQKLSLRV